MTLRCWLMGHHWEGCTCSRSRCHETRDVGHQWNGCYCQKCHKKRDEGHAWDPHSSETGCKCHKCGIICSTHEWEGCLCKRCGTRRDAEHLWEGCMCKRCGTRRDAEHLWEGCICKRCGTGRDAEHRWKGCRCARKGCSAERDAAHYWNGLKCIHCDKSRLPDLDEFSRIPLWAIVAFASRCSRLIEPNFSEFYKVSTEDFLVVFANGSFAAENAASSAGEFNEDIGAITNNLFFIADSMKRSQNIDDDITGEQYHKAESVILTVAYASLSVFYALLSIGKSSYCNLYERYKRVAATGIDIDYYDIFATMPARQACAASAARAAEWACHATNDQIGDTIVSEFHGILAKAQKENWNDTTKVILTNSQKSTNWTLRTASRRRRSKF